MSFLDSTIGKILCPVAMLFSDDDKDKIKEHKNPDGSISYTLNGKPVDKNGRPIAADDDAVAGAPSEKQKLADAAEALRLKGVADAQKQRLDAEASIRAAELSAGYLAKKDAAAKGTSETGTD